MIMGAISKFVSKAILKDTKRGAKKEALKEEFKEKGMTEAQASNKAHREMAKESGKKTALEKVDVKQDRDTSKFKSADSKGGNKTLSIQARDLDSNKFVSMKRKSDEKSTVRSVAERQKLREAGEKMFKAGVKEELKDTAKKAAIAGVAGVPVGKEIGEGIVERREAREKKEKEEKMNMAKGGMVKANCGASVPPAQKRK
jgi:hypothetical protein